MAETVEAKVQTAAETKFQPYVPDGDVHPEFTARAVILGGIFGIIFGAVTVYVGLRAGLTVAASIPISVLSISILRWFAKFCRSGAVQMLPLPAGFKKWLGTEASILENNIVQTTGNAGKDRK